MGLNFQVDSGSGECLCHTLFAPCYYGEDNGLISLCITSVAIARVFLKDPPIVVLDEATSALDARSEYHINQALKTMTKGRTVISIAHRLSTIKEADRIAVLKGGEVVETGTFEELVRSKGAFHKLVAKQLHL